MPLAPSSSRLAPHQDLDAALLSRFDIAIHFPAPTEPERAAIFARHARQLDADSARRLAAASAGLSGRNLLDVCKATERRWACKLARAEASAPLPPEAEYAAALRSRAGFTQSTV